MIRKTIKQIIKEYDATGMLTREEIIETVEEDDNAYGVNFEQYIPQEGMVYSV